MTNIVIADDHPLIATATRTIIEQFKGYKVLYEVDNGQSFIQKIENGAAIPDIILLDMSMPIMDGKTTSLWIAEHYPEIKIIVNTVQVDLRSFLNMFEAGVMGFITKSAKPQTLFNALELVKVNKTCYPEWTENVIQRAFPFSQVPNEIFSEEERLYLSHICAFESYENIARKMNVTIQKVQQFEYLLKLKMNVSTRNALVYFSQINQLISI